ncbi:CoA transferase [Pseudarthrobacter sp. MDT3-9]|nr:CoA transferase [Pseudarthrobacter sp. MDT3-9]
MRIVEIASLAPAPFGCMLLADLGADVLRVDRLNSRPTFSGPAGPLDRGRRSVALDLKSPQGVAAVGRLIRDADVLIEGFRPGVAERLGIGPDAMLEINPRLIYGRMTGWGQEGPLAARAGHDINYVSISGALEPIGTAGEKPHPALNLLGDFAGGGSFLALGILSALYERERSGKGQVIDAAMVDGSSVLMSFIHGMRTAGLWEGERGTNLLDGGASFYGTYETSDGKYMAVGCIEPQFYSQLLEKMGITAGVAGEQMDPSRWPETKDLFSRIFKEKTRSEWTEIFFNSDACVTPVLSPWEAHLHPHNQIRSAFVDVGGVMQPAPAPRFSRSSPASPVPMDAGGRNPSETLAHWGLNPAEIQDLVSRGAVG